MSFFIILFLTWSILEIRIETGAHISSPFTWSLLITYFLYVVWHLVTHRRITDSTAMIWSYPVVVFFTWLFGGDIIKLYTQDSLAWILIISFFLNILYGLLRGEDRLN